MGEEEGDRERETGGRIRLRWCLERGREGKVRSTGEQGTEKMVG